MKLVDADLIADCLRDEIAKNEDDKSVIGMLAKGVLKHLIGLVEDLPAAQPTQDFGRDTNVLSTDYISRQAAIDIVNKYDKSHMALKGKPMLGATPIVIELEDLPSAQPEIVRCKDCKYHWVHRCMDSIPREICDLNQTFYDAEVDFCSLAEKRGEADVKADKGASR